MILAALPSLKPGDLQAIHAAASHLLGSQVAQTKAGAIPLAGLIYEALARPVGHWAAYETFIGGAVGDQYLKKVPAFIKFLDSLKPDWHKKKIPALKFIEQIIDLIIEDLKKRSLPISIGFVVSNLDRAAQVFDDAFPQYRQTGLVHKIFK